MLHQACRRLISPTTVDMQPFGRGVAWRCVQGPDEWVGTMITCDLSTDGVETASQTDT
jgi:hypothetical protein